MAAETLSEKLIDRTLLSRQFPTHQHSPEFWEQLGRVIATFGFLEETLARAIFAVTATTEYSEEEIQAKFEKWPSILKCALSDTLVPLSETYAKTVKEHHQAESINVGILVANIKEVAAIRNALCHGSWRAPNETGESTLFFLNKRDELLDAQIDIQWLHQLQVQIQDIICDVIDSVTVMGWNFPGSEGGGKEVWPGRNSMYRGGNR